DQHVAAVGRRAMHQRIRRCAAQRASLIELERDMSRGRRRLLRGPPPGEVKEDVPAYGLAREIHALQVVLVRRAALTDARAFVVLLRPAAEIAVGAGLLRV